RDAGAKGGVWAVQRASASGEKAAPPQALRNREALMKVSQGRTIRPQRGSSGVTSPTPVRRFCPCFVPPRPFEFVSNRPAAGNFGKDYGPHLAVWPARRIERRSLRPSLVLTLCHRHLISGSPAWHSNSVSAKELKYRKLFKTSARLTSHTARQMRVIMAKIKFRPLHDRVVVKRVEAEEKSKGGIIIPDTAKEKPQQGEVVAVGPGGRDENGKLVPMDLRAGDRVLFGKWSGTEVKLDGDELLIMKESDIMGVIACSEGRVRWWRKVRLYRTSGL